MRRSLSRRSRKIKVRREVDVNGHENTFTRTYCDDVVTPLACDLVSNNRIFWQKVLANEDSRPASVHVVINRGTKHPKLSV